MRLLNAILSSSVFTKVLVVLIVCFAVVMSLFSFSEYEGNKMRMNDMGNMVQSIYNTGRGNIMEFSNEYSFDNPVTNRIGVHANLIFFVLVPFFLVFSDPRILLLIQILVASSVLVPIYFLSQKYFGKKSWWNFFGPLLFVVNPIVHDVLLFDFHALTLAMSICVWALYFLMNKQFGMFYVFALLLALCKEDMPLVVFMFGIYMWLIMDEKKKGLLLASGSMLYFVIMVMVVMPLLRNGQTGLIESRYGYVTSGFSDVLLGIFSMEKIWYLPNILLTTGGLAVLAPQILFIALPSLMVNMISSNSIMHQVYGFYYPAIIIVFVLIGSVVGLGSLKNKKNKYWKKIGGLAFCASLIVSYMNSPLPYSVVSSFDEFKVSEHAKDFNEVIDLIPENASVSIQNNLGYKMAKRRLITTFPHKADSYDYVVLDVTDPYSIVRIDPRQRNFVFITNLSLLDYEESALAVFDDDNYGVFFANDGYLVFKRNEKRSKNEDGYKMFEERIEFLKERYGKFVTEYGQEG